MINGLDPYGEGISRGCSEGPVRDFLLSADAVRQHDQQNRDLEGEASSN
tara:strand:- start:587 stop:733 length:147 start_codon:yes stop_codon:yes gene_type:complete